MKGLYPVDIGNPAEVTYAKTEYRKNRQRLTLEGFKAIHAISPFWMQIAMEISLVTLQGRSEVLNMKFSDYQDGLIKVVRQKTKKHEHAHLEIDCPQLAELISRARQSGIASPYIVHRCPSRKIHSDERDHWTQILPNHFTAEFRRLRDETRLFDGIPRESRPTFHEIRSLGSWIYKQRGYDNESYIQPLMAHADERMTQGYQRGHSQDWVRVKAGLDLEEILTG